MGRKHVGVPGSGEWEGQAVVGGWGRGRRTVDSFSLINELIMPEDF